MISLLFSLVALNTSANEMYSAQIANYRINFSVLPTVVSSDSFSVKKGRALEDPCKPQANYETCEITAQFSGGLMSIQILNADSKLIHSAELPLTYSAYSTSLNHVYCQNPKTLDYVLNGQLNPVLISFQDNGKNTEIHFQPFLNLKVGVRQNFQSLQVMDENRFELQDVSQPATGAFWTNLSSDPHQTRHFTFRTKAEFDRRMSDVDWEAYIDRH